MFGGFCNLLGLSFKGRNYEYAFLPRSVLLEQKRGADGVKIADFRKGRTGVTLILAAAHAHR